MPGRGTRQKFPNALFNVNRGLIVGGSFETAGASAPTNVVGNGFLVTKAAGNGEFTVTFPDYYDQLVCCVATYQDGTATDFTAQVDGYVNTTGVLTLRLIVASTGVADANTSTGDRVNFLCVFQTRGDLAKTWTD